MKIFIIDDQPLPKFCRSLKIFVNVCQKCLILPKPISNKFVNFTEFMSILLPHRRSFVIVRKSRDFYVGMLRMMCNVQKSGLQKNSGVCVRVCAKGRRNESLVIRKRIELSGWNLVCYRSWYYSFIAMNFIESGCVLNINIYNFFFLKNGNRRKHANLCEFPAIVLQF